MREVALAWGSLLEGNCCRNGRILILCELDTDWEIMYSGKLPADVTALDVPLRSNPHTRALSGAPSRIVCVKATAVLLSEPSPKNQ